MDTNPITPVVDKVHTWWDVAMPLILMAATVVVTLLGGDTTQVPGAVAGTDAGVDSTLVGGTGLVSTGIATWQYIIATVTGVIGVWRSAFVGWKKTFPKKA